MRAVSHLPIKLVFACLLAVAMLVTLMPLPLRAQEAGPSVAIAPGRSGDTAVRYSDTLEARLDITGAAPAGAIITAARLVPLGADGAPVGDPQIVPSDNRNNPGHHVEDDYLFVDSNGQLQGALRLHCPYFGSREIGCPANPATPVRDVRLDLTVAGADASSNVLRVDYTRPIVRKYETIAPQRIKVVFSEPVRTNATALTEPNQWTVESSSDGVARSVTAVGSGGAGDCTYDNGEDSRAGASGCTRVLTITGPALGEDETPQVSLRTGALSPITEAYEDFASNQVLLSADLNAANQATSDALDGIRPAAPNIETVDGKSPDSDAEVISTTGDPKVVLTNLTAGHTVELSFTRNGTTTTMPPVEVPAGADTVEVTPTLPEDGDYGLSAVATDGAGNRSDDGGEAARADGTASLNYVLDTVAPEIASAAFVNRKTVTVVFSENVKPSNNAGEWTIGDVPADATGEGATRQLTAQVDTSPGAGINWKSTDGSTYTDRAANALATVTAFPVSDLPAVPAPTVTAPTQAVHTAAAKTTIAGTAPSGNEYLVAELFERNADKPLAQTSAAEGSWTFDYALPAEQRSKLQVRLRDTGTYVASPRVDVPAIVHDTTAPAVDVQLPAHTDLLGAPEQFGVGDRVTISWTATDSAENDPQQPDHSRTASIFLVADGAATRIADGIAAKPGTEQSLTYTLKSSDLAGERVRDITFRVDVDDFAGNVGDDVSGTIRLLVSTSVPAPVVSTPAQSIFTSASNVAISGSAPSDSEYGNEYLVAELLERGSDSPLATTSVAGGSWRFDHTVAADQRNELQVRLRDRETMVTSGRADVPDIVHDGTAPVVDVRSPASGLTAPQEYGVGDSVTITWVSTDKANDPQQPDHSRTASVFKVSGSGSTALASGIEAKPGSVQTFTYALTRSDLAGQGLRDLAFRVDVSDLAGNVGRDVSGSVRLLGDRVGYTPVLVAPGLIEARFSEELQGTMLPTDWRVGDQPAVAEQPVVRNGVTVVVLRNPLDADPNATPSVEFTPTLPATERLRSLNDSQISLSVRDAVDRVVPALVVKRPGTPRAVDADTVTVTGTTDVTRRPNTIAAYRADATGTAFGDTIATGTAQTDGSWSMRVPLQANRLNRIVFRAIDPSGNRSETLPNAPYEVREDSLAPVVTLLSPEPAARLGATKMIRWSTVEKNKRAVVIAYRLRGATTWYSVARTADDGSYAWDVPTRLHNRRFRLKVTARDAVGKSGAATARGLSADINAPSVRTARSIAPRKVRVVFNEAVRGTRAGAFEVDGRAVRRIKGSGDRRTLVLRRGMKRTTPVVEYSGKGTTDVAGNRLRATQMRAVRGFAFPVAEFDATRMSARSVELTWRDGRNRSQHLRGYRIYRDGKRIALVSWSTRSFRDAVTGSHVYAVRALDDQGRLSATRRDRVR